MKLPKPQKPLLFLVILSVVAGITVYAASGPWLSQLFTAFSKPASNKITQPTRTPKSPPTSINIPKIGKNLPIKSATVSGNTWDMFPDAVAWLSTSATPGEGNVILYAHDWTSLWADLYLLKPGDTIEVQQGARTRTYTVSASRAVNEHDIQSILSHDNRLTLYTCEGNFDQKRRVVYATPAAALTPQK